MKQLRTAFLAASLFLAATAWATDSNVVTGQMLGASLGAQNPLGDTTTQQTTSSMLSVNGAASGKVTSAGGTLGLNGSQTATVNLICDGAAQFPRGVGIRATGCSGSPVASMQISACLAGLTGGACNTADWSAPQTLSAGGSASFGANAKVVLGTCTANACSATVTASNSMSTSSGTMQGQGSAAAAATGANSAFGMTSNTVSSGNYQASIQNMGSQYVGCVNDVNTALNTDGTVYNCNKTGTYNFGANGTQCTTVTQCVQQASVTNSWTETCNTDVPIVQQQCTTVTPAEQCSISMPKQTFTCNKTLTVTVTATTSGSNCTSGTQVASASGGLNGGGHVSVTCSGDNTHYVLSYWETYNHCNAGGSATQAMNTSAQYMYNNGCGWSDGIASTISCNGTTCYWSGTFYSGTRAESSASGSWPQPGPKTVYTYTDTWSDGCATYENAT